MTEQEKKEALKRWQEHCKRVERMTSQERVETEAERKRNIARALRDYDCFCQRYLSHYCQCPNAKFHNEAARYIASHPELRLVCKWPRGHAKSVHLDIGIPLWLKFRSELHVMVLVGKSEDSADGLLGDLQAELQYNQYLIRDFGEQYNSGMWQEGEFVTRDQCAFFSRGRGQSPRGLRFREMRPDYIVVDDLDDDEMCRSEARVREMTNWIKEALFGCFGGKDGRFIMVGNLISKNSVLQKIIDTPTVKTIEVNAIDRNGNPAWPEFYTIEKLRDREQFMGYRSFQKEYMNNPITEGAVFQERWIRWRPMLKLKYYEQIVLYIDPSWKSSGKNDYKAAASAAWAKWCVGSTMSTSHCLRMRRSVSTWKPTSCRTPSSTSSSVKATHGATSFPSCPTSGRNPTSSPVWRLLAHYGNVATSFITKN